MRPSPCAVRISRRLQALARRPPPAEVGLGPSGRSRSPAPSAAPAEPALRDALPQADSSAPSMGRYRVMIASATRNPSTAALMIPPA